MSTLTAPTPHQTCESVLKLIESNPDCVDMGEWEIQITEENECQTVACIAGWTGLLHEDSYRDMYSRYDNCDTASIFKEERCWIERQGKRLGLSEEAAYLFFYIDKAIIAEEMLRLTLKHLEDNKDSDLITLNQMEEFLDKAKDTHLNKWQKLISTN